MRCDERDLLLYAVTDRTWLAGRTLASQVAEALEGGATMRWRRGRTASMWASMIWRRAGSGPGSARI